MGCLFLITTLPLYVVLALDASARRSVGALESLPPTPVADPCSSHPRDEEAFPSSQHGCAISIDMLCGYIPHPSQRLERAVQFDVVRDDMDTAQLLSDLAHAAGTCTRTIFLQQYQGRGRRSARLSFQMHVFPVDDVKRIAVLLNCHGDVAESVVQNIWITRLRAASDDGRLPITSIRPTSWAYYTPIYHLPPPITPPPPSHTASITIIIITSSVAVAIVACAAILIQRYCYPTEVADIEADSGNIVEPSTAPAKMVQLRAPGPSPPGFIIPPQPPPCPPPTISAAGCLYEIGSNVMYSPTGSPV